MSIATLVERIISKQHRWQAAKSADFHDIVVQIADGREPDADLVAQSLRDAAKSIDDLQKAVELLQRRRELREQWDSIPRRMAQRQELEHQMAEADRELEVAESKHFAIVNPICLQLERIKEAIQESENAKRELLGTCTDPILLDKLADVQMRLSKRREEASDLRRQIDNLRDWEERERAEAERRKTIIDDDGNAQIKVHLARAKEHERKASERESLLAKTNKMVTELEREEAAIRNEMLVP